MKEQTRRRFVAGAIGLGATATLSAAGPDDKSVASYPLVHHVFFWLMNPNSKEDQAKLIEGLRTLGDIPSVKAIHIGVPASTETREVVDNSFAASEILYFEDVEGQNEYQVHSIHTAFVENYSHLWNKVIVYDAIAVE